MEYVITQREEFITEEAAIRQICRLQSTLTALSITYQLTPGFLPK